MSTHKIFISLIFVLALASMQPANAQESSIRQIEAPIRYGGESTNAEIAYHNNAVYVAYADINFMLTVARLDVLSGVWTKAVQIDQTLGESDPSHNQIALAIDGDGYIHVWYGMHNAQGMRYARSNQPDDVVSGFTIRSAEFPRPDDQYTYPNAATAPNGDVYFSVRQQGRTLPLFRWDHALKYWQEVAVVVDGDASVNFGQTYTPYLPWLYVDSDNNVHIKWDWAFGTARSERHYGSYALYKPSTGIFYRANGTPYILPITVKTSDIFQSMPDGVNWNNEGIALSDLAVDGNNRPVISYAFSPVGAADHWQHRVAHWDGTNWVQNVLTNDTKKWNKNFLITGQGTLYYYARTNQGSELWTSPDNGNTWSGATLVYTRPIDGAIAIAPDTHVLLHLSGTAQNNESQLSFVQFDAPN